MTGSLERNAPRRDGVPRAATLWLPLAVAAAPVLMAAWAGWHVATGAQGLSDAYRLTANFLNSELGPVELGTALILLFALVAGLRAGWLAVLDARNLLLGWLALTCLGILYFAGEELSWGQQLFAWETGDWFMARNDQKETNFHNMSALLDQLPRNLLLIWCLVGGVLAPLYEHVHGGFSPRGWAYWVWPTRAATLSALLVLAARLPEDLVNLFAVSLDSRVRWIVQPLRWSEVQELLVACFLLVYTLALYRRLAKGLR